MTEMTRRERWLASVDRKPLDHLVFWPKLNGSCVHAYGSRLGCSTVAELHDALGTDVLAGAPSSVVASPTECSRTVRRNGDWEYAEIECPSGRLTSTRHFDIASQSWHPVEFPVKSTSDLRPMADYYRDLGLSVNEENLEAVRVAREGKSDRYFAWEAIGESPLMHFVEHLAGVENAHYLLYDAPDGVFDLFEAMHEHLTAKTTMVCEITEADMVAFIENTSTTLISPTQYRSIDLPHLVTYARIARDHSRRFALHMCGFLKDILPDVDKVGASVFEAFTSPPVGNTPFAVGREQCPDVCLIGGTNASLWLEPAAGIIEEIDRSLSELPHHRGIVVSSAGVMPPACPPETIQAVREFVTSYPVRV